MRKHSAKFLSLLSHAHHLLAAGLFVIGLLGDGPPY